ncbi:MAG TPA: hypothetical protein V6D26_14445 [Stenomitos sp.]
MLALSLMTLAIAFVAVYISLKVTDEILQLTIALTALLCLFLSLVFLPWPVELLLVIALWVLSKHSHTLTQTYVKTAGNQEIACPFPLAFAIANRCVIHPTAVLEKFEEREIRRMCRRTCCYTFRDKR